ncbi:MAG TPA: surface-adhesin E family protein [Gemmatimonadaceae bacterium]
MHPTAPLLLLAAAVLPQSKWQEIGKTSTGNSVYLDGKSVRKAPDGIVTARVRVTYAPPLDTPKGKITSSRVLAMFDCAKGLVATRESVLYLNEAKGVEYSRRTIGKPGFGPALSSTFADVALKHLCRK